MEIASLVRVLDQPHLAADHLHGWGLRDVQRGRQILLELAETGLTLDLLAVVCRQLGEHLPQLPDPDAALDAFGRYLFAVRSPLALAALLERDAAAAGMLLRALSLGPQWAETLIDDPEAFDLLRQNAGQAESGGALKEELLNELQSLRDPAAATAELARFRQRRLLQIAYGEIVEGQALRLVAEQLAELVDATIAAALATALLKVDEIKPLASRIDRSVIRSAVIAVGEVGAREPGYWPPLSLLVVYDTALSDVASRQAIHDYFDRVARAMARIASAATGQEVRLLTLPDGSGAAGAHASDDVVVGFDTFGRTWHRQEMLKARPVAGDQKLGEETLARLGTWLFRRYLGRADETGIKALKRRILLEATIRQDEWRSVRQGRGGLRDVEATIEFLQLLAGGDHPAARAQGTRAALAGLAESGTIAPQERAVLEEGYDFLRRLEHRLQVHVNLKAHELPANEALLAHVTASFGEVRRAEELLGHLRKRLDENWQTIEKLLASAFPHQPPTPREVELLLDPAPPREEIGAALAPFGFQDPVAALTTLHNLATERVPFLSTRRCRHLLATILPRLLCAIGATPNPDRTLDNLARISDSLGGKGVLWELLGASPPTLDLYVKLCAASPYLADILTTNPGMIDELVDSLQLNKLPSLADLQATLAELSRGADDTLPILHDFKNAEHLRIGVREMLGKEDIDETHAALADVAETCLAHVAEVEYRALVEKFGEPTIGPGPLEGEKCSGVIVGLGKLGGREPNYHSHLDVLFLYEADGVTQARRSRRAQPTAHSHFFTQLAQRVVKQLAEHTPKGRLYAVDAVLRPIGIGGALALSFADFAQHFASGAAPWWQWQALCQARPVYGDREAIERAAALIRQLLVERRPRAADASEARESRGKLAINAAPTNLKRGPGGTLDIEFVVQMLQLRHAAEHPAVLSPHTRTAIAALAAAGVLGTAEAEQLADRYGFLRRIESAICLRGCLTGAGARHELPADDQELRQLAFLLGHGNPARLGEQCRQVMAANRAVFDAFTMESQA